MNTIAKIINSSGNIFDRIAKARMQSTLLCMGQDWVERQGYSWELLRTGTAQWPWRQTPEAAAEEQEIRRAIQELKQFSDRELHDIGISRGSIEHAVRYGIAKNDCGSGRGKSVA